VIFLILFTTNENGLFVQVVLGKYISNDYKFNSSPDLEALKSISSRLFSEI